MNNGNGDGNGDGPGDGNEGRPAPPQRKVQHEMKIQIFDNGQIGVTDIPMDFDQAISIMASAYRAVANLFVQEALRGKARSVTKGSGLLVPKGCGGIIIPN